jgi:hypothetical protein
MAEDAKPPIGTIDEVVEESSGREGVVAGEGYTWEKAVDSSPLMAREEERRKEKTTNMTTTGMPCIQPRRKTTCLLLGYDVLFMDVLDNFTAENSREYTS